MHAAGCDLTQARDGGFVLRLHERVVALHELPSSGGGEDNEGEAVLLAL
jgi:hypothetical protein